MEQQKAAHILSVLAEMKQKASDPVARLKYDRLAVEVMTQDIRPIKMADNLKYWLDLHAA